MSFSSSSPSTLLRESHFWLGLVCFVTCEYEYCHMVILMASLVAAISEEANTATGLTLPTAAYLCTYCEVPRYLSR
jgi:hypothetical protein